MSQEVQWTDVASAVAAMITALILLFAAVFGGWQVTEARRLREAQTRPFVSIDLDWAEFPLLILRIENSGSVMARNVGFEFEPPPASSFDQSGHWGAGRKIAEAKIFSEGIPALPPGKAIPMVFEGYTQRKETDLPSSYRVAVSCQGEARNWRRKRKVYKDEFVIDLALYEAFVRLEKSPAARLEENLKRIESVLREIRDALGGGQIIRSPHSQ